MNFLIIVLTHNRPRILDRCIRVAIERSSTANKATWLVIDNSSFRYQQLNSVVLQKLKKKIPILHITSSRQRQILQILSDEFGNKSCNATFGKSFSRDISGLRNIGMLTAFVLSPKLIFFIDDDIVVQKNNDFFDSVVKRYRNNRNCIVGATLTGIIDESYYGRLLYLVGKGMPAICKVPSKSQSITQNRRNPLWIRVNKAGRNKEVTNTSAGLLAFKFNNRDVLPFPLGYNEDWSWCLLQKLIKKTKIFKDKTQAFHSPPTVYQPNATGMIWELHGEIIYESIFRAMCKKSVLSLGVLRSSAKEACVLRSTVEEMTSLERGLQGLQAKTKRSDDTKKILTHLGIVKDAIKTLNSLDANTLLNSWFTNFKMRHHLFLTIFNKTRLQSRLLKAVEAGRLQ